MFRSFVRSFALVALVAGFASHAFALTEPWSQERVTVLAKDLAKAVSGLREAVKNSPSWQNPQQRKNLYKIADILRQIEQECISLHAQLAKGAGMEETQSNFEHIQRLKRRAQVLVPKSDVSAITQPKLDLANGLLKQLEPYYPAPEAPAK